MTWQNDINNNFYIETADGKRFFPNFKQAPEKVGFYSQINDYPNVPFTFAQRGQIKSPIHTLVFDFVGADMADQWKAFKKSAVTVGTWTINDPFDGLYTCIPITDFTAQKWLNDYSIKGDVMEVSPDISLSETQDTRDKIATLTISYNESSQATYGEKSPDVADEALILEDTRTTRNLYTELAQINEDLAVINNAANEVIAVTDDLLKAPASVLQTVQALKQLPQIIEARVQDRVNAITRTLDALYAELRPETPITRKNYAGASAGASIAALCNVVITPLADDYLTAEEVAVAAQVVHSLYINYIETFDELRVNKSLNDPQFSLEGNDMQVLEQLVLTTVAELQSVAFGARQQRTVILKTDRNLYDLCVELYGNRSEANLNLLIRTNNIGIEGDEIVVLPKGKEIKFFVEV